MMWGGEEEQAAECAKGNTNTKNWQDEALKIVEQVVSAIKHSVAPLSLLYCLGGEILEDSTHQVLNAAE
jgi:hypothetical protein